MKAFGSGEEDVVHLKGDIEEDVKGDIKGDVKGDIEEDVKGDAIDAEAAKENRAEVDHYVTTPIVEDEMRSDESGITGSGFFGWHTEVMDKETHFQSLSTAATTTTTTNTTNIILSATSLEWLQEDVTIDTEFRVMSLSLPLPF